MDRCSEEFGRSLRPHIHELREDYARNRERNTFENEAQASFLQSIDLPAALGIAQEACRRMQEEELALRAKKQGTVAGSIWASDGGGVVGIDWLFNPEQPEICGVEHDKIFTLFAERRAWLPLPGYVSDFLGTRTAYEIDCGMCMF